MKIKLLHSKLVKVLFVFVVLFTTLFESNLYAQSPSTFTTSGTWVCPRGVTSIQVEAVGGGAGGRTTANTNGHVGGGGGGGAYAKRVGVTVVPGTTYTITIGAGGASNTAGGNSTANFGGTTITAAGGSIGVASGTGIITGGAGGTVAASLGDALSVFPGGTGGSGLGNGSAGGSGSGGGGGSGAGSIGFSNAGGNATTTNAPGAGGLALTNYGGAGGAGGNNANGVAASIAAGNYGGGGGGAGHKNNTGGTGQSGVIVITFTCPTETANAGPDQTLAACANTATLAGNAPVSSGLTGTWTLVSGTATITTPTSATSTVTGLVLGTSAVLRWTIDNGRCGSTNDTVTITTVNPTISSQPVNTSTCVSTGIDSFSVTATNATSYQWRKGTTNLTNTAPFSGVNTGLLTITNPSLGDAAIDYNVVISGCVTSNNATLTLTPVPSSSTTPSPATAATGICYAGIGALSAVSWAATATATSYDVYFGPASLPGSVTSNVATNSYSTGTLLANTTYYWKVVAKNTCGSAVGSTTWTFTTAASACLSYCTAGGSAAASSYISNVTLNAINQNNSAWNGYLNYYTSLSTNLFRSTSYTISVSIYNATTSQKNISAWIDWNLNSVFDVATETVLSTTSTLVTAPQTVVLTGTFTVPADAVLDFPRLRVELAFNSEGAAAPCNVNSLTDVQDYKINVLDPPVCTTPAAQPTVLTLNPSGNSISGSFTAASPAPNNYLVVFNTTGVAPTPVNGTTYTVGGTVGAGNTVVDIDSDTSFTASGLSLLTTYYLFVYSYNSACTGGPLYLTTSPLNGTSTTLSTTYCIPTGDLNCSSNNDYIANVTINTLNNSTTCSAGGYTNFAATGTKTTTVTRGNTYNLSVGTGPGNKKHGLAVWIDFNQNSVFTDAGEFFLIGNGVIANSTNTITVAIPAGATLGATRMRVRYGRQTTMASTSSCTTSGTNGETEDYTITIADPIVCVAPTTQPTALLLNSTGTTISGSFTAPSPAPNNYLVVINTTGVAPTPVNATTYTVGGTVGAGNTVVDIDSNTAFVATGLTALTTYYIFVFSYNSACAGGPTYNVTSPLNGSIATIVSNYCIPSVSSGQQSLGYFSEVSFVGTLNDVSNYSTYSSSPLGYQDFTSLPNLSVQAQGEGVNVSVQALNSSFMKAWVDWNKDGDFLDVGELVYDTGGISTYSSTFGFIIPSSQALGNYRIRLRLNSRDFSFPYDANSTNVYTSCGNINYGGETEDYLFTVAGNCNALISTVTDGRTCGAGTVNLAANSASAGVTQYRWYTTPTGSTLVGTSPTGSWTTPSISTTTTYYVTVFNGCESLVRTAVTATVSPIPSLTYSPTNPTVCGEDVILNLTATGDLEEVHLIDEKFTSGLGTFTNTNIVSTTENTNSQWQNRTSTFVPTPVTNYNVWFPAISTGVNGNGFAMATSDVGGVTVHNQMASATISSASFVNLTLSMRLFYSRYYIDDANLTLDYVTVDVSTNGGGAWTEIKRYTEDVGIGTRFETVTFDLSAYINQANLKVRVRYYGEWCDGLAIDDIKLYGYRPIGTSLNWTCATPVAAFTDAACTVPYVVNTPAANVYVKPTLAQLEQGSYSFTANAVLSNGCSTSQTIVVTNNSKVWQGGTNWENPANWKPNGIPTSSSCVIIANTSIIPGSNFQAYAKNVTVKPTGNLDITAGSYLTVTDFVNVNPLGIFTLKNTASLVQINNTAINIGNIMMDRTTHVRNTDYVYWSSPVANFSAAAISPGTSTNYIYKWNPTIANSNGGEGNWVSGNETMAPGKGYIVRGPNSYTSTAADYTANSTGVPFNGIIQPSISRGNRTVAMGSITGTNGVTITPENDNWNLVGNPYPSSIKALDFLTDNTNIAGNVRLWRHGLEVSTAYSSSFYATYGYNYSSTDYINYNGLGPNPPGFDGYIGAGQGFFILMNDGAATTESVTFNNSMRSNTYTNSQFFKTNLDAKAQTEPNKHRIWLSLLNATNIATTTLIGYTDGATYGFDRLYDAPFSVGAAMSIYSLINDKSMTIQGRPTPFDTTDTVPLGFKVETTGTHTIALSQVDGLFENNNQGIYLDDTALGIVHDLRLAPYSFKALIGTTNSRFVLRYTNASLGNESSNVSQTFAFITNNRLHIQSSDTIKEIEVYDITGKLVTKYQPSELKNQFETDFFFAKGTYITKISLESGSVISRKLLH